MSVKRKRAVVDLETKMKAIGRVDKGETKAKIARELGVGESTVREWVTNREKICQWCSQKSCSGMPSPKKRKVMKDSIFEKTSEALFLWFCQMRGKGCPITGPILQEKAMQLHGLLKDGDSEFTASQGWLNRWKERHGVRQLYISGEKLSAAESEVEPFKERLRKFLKKENLTLDQIYNCDETGLNHRMLPKNTLAAKQDAAAPGFKKSKDRVTVLACSNASGNHRLPLLVIGKAQKPRAFKNLNVKALPCQYANQKSAWMDAGLFKTWFHEEFVPETEKFLAEKGLARKAVLLLDNAPSHPDVTALVNGDIKALFLPPNVTSLIQPLDQSVLETLKRRYRRNLLKQLITAMDEGETVTECLKRVNMKDVIYWLADAWNDIKQSTLQKCWRKLLQSIFPSDYEDDIYDEEDDEPLINLVRRLPHEGTIVDADISDWMNADEEEELTDAMLVSLVTKNEDNVDENEDADVPETVENDSKVSHSRGLEAIQLALQYLEQQPETTPADLMLLKRMEKAAAHKRSDSMGQTTIEKFFTK